MVSKDFQSLRAKAIDRIRAEPLRKTDAMLALVRHHRLSNITARSHHDEHNRLSAATMQQAPNRAGEPREFRPSHYLTARDSPSPTNRTALVILNSPISDIGLFRALHSHAAYRLCADGGANRLHDLLVHNASGVDSAEALKSGLPDAIHGDLDSLQDDVRQKFLDLGVAVTQDGDQYSTDFGKATKKIVEVMPNVQEMLILGSLGGRLDQGVGLLHELYREQHVRHPRIRFWFFTEASVSVVIPNGRSVIYTPLTSGLLTRNVGILPLYGAASISTEGFEWDVHDWPTEMGGQVSTSNHVLGDQVSIQTNKEVLFTIELGSLGRGA